MTANRSTVATLVCTLVVCMGLSFGAKAADMPQVGATYSDNVPLEDFSIPLPAGTWEVYYAVEERDNPTFPASKVALLQTDGGVVSRLIYARAVKALNRKGFKAYRNCEKPEYFHSMVRVNRHGLDQDCWHMRAENLTTGSGSSPREQALIKYTKDRNYVLLLTAVGPRYHFADRNASVRVSYSWIPDLIYKAPKSLNRKVWLYQDWTADEIGKDATRKVVMRQFKRFGEDFYPRMQEMFLNREGDDATAPAVTGSDEAAGENNDDDPDEGQANPGGQK